MSIMPNARVISWDPGVRNSIPFRTVIYSTLSSVSNVSTIQSTLNTCPSGQVVLLAPGTYSLSAVLTIPSNVTLRGSGTGVTILQSVIVPPATSFASNACIQFNNGYDTEWTQTPRNLISPTKDSTTITTVSGHGWSVGDLILIDMIEQPLGDPPISNSGSLGTATWVGRDSGTRPIGQLVKIQTIPTSATATIDPPLYWSYSNTPQGTKMTGITNYAGVENLTIDNLIGSARDTVALFGSVNCWLYDIELKGNYRYTIWGYGSLWFTMQHCRVTGGIPIATDNTSAYDSSRSYGSYFGPHFTAGLLTDNIYEKVTMAVSFEGAAAGNVFSYNLIKDIWWRNTGDSPRRFGPLMHGPHPFMNLWEGNWSEGRARADEYWGTSSHFTVFRNRIVQIDRGSSDAQTWTIDIERNNWYWSFIGNIIGGTVGITTGAVLENKYELVSGANAPYTDTNSTIWKIGYQSLGTDSTNYDIQTLLTMIRWGNWSPVTDNLSGAPGQNWHIENVVDTTDRYIPDSYYINTRPSFFYNLSWPPFDPARPMSVSMTNIPAGYRYTYGVDPGATYYNKTPKNKLSVARTGMGGF